MEQKNVISCTKRNRHRWKGRYIGKRWGLSKNPGFTISQGSISALSHEVLPLILKIQQCSYQHAASVLCRAGLETLLGILHFSSACPTTFLRRKSSDKQYQFLHTRSIHNNLNCVLHFFNNEQETRFLMKFVSAKTISRPKNPIMAAYGPDPQKPICFFRVPTVTFFLWFNYGFLKAGVLFKIQKYGFRTG